jgi:hypothetical protein
LHEQSIFGLLEKFLPAFQRTSSNTMPGDLEGSCSRYLVRFCCLRKRPSCLWCAHCYSSEDD